MFGLRFYRVIVHGTRLRQKGDSFLYRKKRIYKNNLVLVRAELMKLLAKNMNYRKT